MRKNIVLTIACVAAVLTCFIVPPDDAYLGYVDVKTIACLFSILAVVGAMRNLGHSITGCPLFLCPQSKISQNFE